MKQMTPIKTLREVNGATERTLELAEFANAAYGRVETEPAPPDRATGLPVKDAIFSNGGGLGSLVVSGRGDDTPFPEDVARVSGRRSSSADPAQDFGPRTPVPEDGFGDRGSGVDNIVRGRG